MPLYNYMIVRPISVFEDRDLPDGLTDSEVGWPRAGFAVATQSAPVPELFDGTLP